MNKVELIGAMAEKAEISKKDAENALAAFTKTITNSLINGDKITITGFGSFETVDRVAREGRNPQTGETISLPAFKSPKFKPGKTLKDAVRG